MKRLFITLVATLLVALTLSAQENVFEKYADTEGVTTVYISKKMFNMMKDVKSEDLNLGTLSGKINDMQILTCEDKGTVAKLRKDIAYISPDNGYEELMRVREEGERITIYAKEGKKENEYILLVDDSEELVLIQINGQLTLEELHKSFAFLSQEEQKYANLFLHDVQTGDVKLQEGVTFQDYIYRYVNYAKQEQIRRLHKYFGLREDLVSQLLERNVTKENLNEYGRFDALKATVVKEKAAEYFTRLDGKKMPMFRVNNRVNALLTEFFLEGGMDIPEPPDGENQDQ